MSSYLDFIQQRFDDFPKEEFKIKNNELLFNDLPLMELIEQFGTPLRLTYLQKNSEKIRQARSWFHEAMQKHEYNAEYMYCYCTKSSHFEFVLSEVLKNNVQIETSSAFDINILENFSFLVLQ